MTGDDLKRMQDGFIDGAKKILADRRHLTPIAFVVTRHKHVEKLFENGWGVEFLDPKSCLRDAHDDSIAAVVVDLAMDYQRMYHAILNVFPPTREILPRLLELGEMVQVDDPYARIVRPFLRATRMHEKDVMSETLRHVCDKAEAFACIMQSEAWLRAIDVDTEDAAKVTETADREGLGQDLKSVEVIYSSLESREFARLVTVPIQRRQEPGEARRDDGEVLGFGDPTETLDVADGDYALKGRLAGFLKPLAEEQ